MELAQKRQGWAQIEHNPQEVVLGPVQEEPRIN
jgi:hypothetical protein